MSESKGQPVNTEESKPLPVPEQKEEAVAAPEEKKAAQAPAKTKSYIERIMDLEKQTFFLLRRYIEAEQTIDQYAQVVEELNRLVNGLQEQMSGIYVLIDEGKPLSTKNLKEKISDIRAKGIEKSVERTVKEGLVVEVDSITGGDCLVAFSTERLKYCYQAVKTFGEDLMKKLIDKKKGDVVEGITILSIYKAAPPKVAPAQKSASPQDNSTNEKQ